MQFSTLKGRRVILMVCGVVALAVAAPAFGHQAAAPATVGNAAAGKSLFTSTCGTCHTLKAAATAGVLGPNLNTIKKLTEVQIISQIEHGGAGIIGAAAAKHYAVSMIPYAYLGKTKIDNLAAFVFKSQG
jgi:mono/diheme cytochrome c family protein